MRTYPKRKARTLTQMEIQTVVVGGLQMPSLIVLRSSEDEPVETHLPIRIGPVEAAAITEAIDHHDGHRPLTHDLFSSTIERLGGHVVAVHIVDVQGTTFFANLCLERADGSLTEIDCRPSDAIALAVRTKAPIYVRESVLATATMPDFQKVEKDAEEQEMAAFHDFVEGLNPEDFA